MKMVIKSIIVGLLVAASTIASQAQGTINFFTSTSNTTKGKIYSDPLNTVYAGAGYVGQLWGGSSAGNLTAISPVITFSSGSGGATALSGGSINPAGTQAGDIYFYQVRAWAGNTSSSWPGVGFGANQSTVVQVTLGGTDVDQNIIAVPTTANWTSFNLVPEPATMALFGLGGAALLMIRRRK